jgi:cytochrome c-type biogenesis protein CcmE
MKTGMKAKHQRLTLGLLALAAVLGSGLLAMSALKDQAAYFYAPSDVARLGVPIGKGIRLGGMVVDHSIKRAADGVTIHFTVTDNARTVQVAYKGITPDLFKEKSGVIAEGSFVAPGQFVATNILAKHDEKYMPPEMAGKMHKTGKVE